MKTPKSIKLDIQKQVMKKTVDGIINVLLRMYAVNEITGTFEDFCKDILTDSPEEFYARPIKEELND